MKKYIVQRLLYLIPILLGITILSFGLMRTVTGDAIDVMEANRGTVLNEEAKAQMRSELNLDKPFIVQYGIWLKDMMAGDMGKSYVSGKPVFSTFMEKLPTTILLTITSIIATIIISVPLGIISAVKHNKWEDYIIRFLSFIGNSLPGFFVSLLLIYIFSIKLNLLPVMNTSVNIQSIIMPTMTLTIAMSAKYIRQIRTVILEELNKDYVIAAKARGIRYKTIMLTSIMKVVLLSFITLLSLSIGSLLGGTAIIESIFMWDGVGKMAVDAILMRDYPVILAYVVWLSIIYVIFNLITDILYHYLDPRIRLGLKEYFMNVKFIILSALVGTLLIIAVFAPVLTPFDPYEQNLSNMLSPPDSTHLLGTDQYGRDLLSRVIMGAQNTILSSLVIVFVITVIGTVIGVICGYFGGKIDTVLMRISDIFLAFPGMVFAIAVAGVLGGSILNAIIALSCISWPKFARLARAQVLTVKDCTFVSAAKLNNCSNIKIMFYHILPNIIGIILITAILDIGTIIMEIAGLSFLGLGALPPTAEWGAMMSNGRSMLQTAPWVILAPGCAIFISVSLFNIFGDTVRDKFDL